MYNFLSKFLFLILLLTVLITDKVKANERFTLSGYVRDAGSGENLIGATIIVNELGRGAVSNQYGFYSISLQQGSYQLNISYIGYENQTIEIELNDNIRLNINMLSTAFTTDEVVITADRPDQNVKSAEMSKIDLVVEDIKALPVVFGEVDIMKTIQLLPGIQNAGEGSTGLYVRGGGPDQNLVLLDGATVYNASHLFGFFSVFNSDAINNLVLHKGGMPANYGGRLSSVVDISLKDGNNRRFHGTGGIGLISSRLMLEGPLEKEKSSFMVAGRRTYIDILVNPFLADSIKGNRYHFYDLNAKVNYQFSEKDRLFLSGYFGRDVFSFQDQGDGAFSGLNLSTDWGNSTLTMRWNRLLSDRLFSNLSLIYNDYFFTFGITQDEFLFEIYSGIRDYSVKLDFDFYQSLEHHIKFGMDFTNHKFTPGLARFESADEEAEFNVQSQYANSLAFYVLDEFELGDRFMFNAGLRYSLFNQIGPYERIYREAGSLPDTVTYKTWENIQFYHGLEPRLTGRYLLTPGSSIKASFTKTNQYIHLASATGGTLPTDLWVPSTEFVEPQISWQYTAGFFKNLFNNSVEASVEAYYKYMENQVDFRPGANMFLNEYLDEEFLQGRGDSYGIEFFINKVKGKTTGWIGYTWSNTTRQIDGINNDLRFSPRYDITHDVSFVMTYKITNYLDASLVFVYASGRPYTPQTGRYFGNFGINQATLQPDFSLVPIYPDQINKYRMENYHRADISLNYKPYMRKEEKINRKFKSYWNFSVYNLYNRKNPYFYDFEVNRTDGTVRVRKIYIFPILPSISYNFKF